MPLYTLRCPEGHESEHLLPIERRDEDQSCAQCGSVAHRRLDFQIAHRMRRHGVMHIPGYNPARFSHEQVAQQKRKDQ